VGLTQKVLVTGGTGFLGSSLVKRLLSMNLAVVVLDNDFRGSAERLSEVNGDITLITGDVRDEQTVINAGRGCSAIFHLAFVNGTRFFYEKPELVLDVGVRGAISAIEAARLNNVSTFVLASSSEVYQEPTEVPTKEDECAKIPDVQNPRYSYAGGKLISELLAINCFRFEQNIRDLIFRPHNVFGPNMGNEHVIPEIIHKLIKASDSLQKKDVQIEIQGSGEETRAFCFIEDAVDQILAIYLSGIKGEVYHVGVDREMSIKSLISNIAGLLGLNVAVVPGELRKGSTPRRCPDTSKVNALGHKFVDRFQSGLNKTVNWYVDQSRS